MGKTFDTAFFRHHCSRVLFYVTDHSRHMHGQHMLSKISLWHPLPLNGGGFAVPAPRRAAGQDDC